MTKFYDNLELINLVNKLENVPNLTSLKVNGFFVWPILRISICFDLISKRYDPNVFIKKKSKKSQLSKIISFFNFFKMKYKIDLLNVTHDIYLNKIGNTVYDRVHFGDEFKKKNSSKIKRLNLANYTIRDIKNNSEVFDFSILIPFFKIVSIPYTLILLIKNYHLIYYLFVVNKTLKKNKFNAQPNLLKIPLKISYTSLLSKFIAYLIKRTGIKKIHHANYYSLESMAITLAAKRRTVDVINFQHGVQSEDHPAFSSWKNIPPDGYELLPTQFLCWDTDSFNNMNEFFKNNASHSVKLSNYDWVDAWKNQEISFDFRDLVLLSKNKFNVLITLQPSIIGLQEVLKNCINKSSKDVKWWIRLHPRQNNISTAKDIKKSIVDKIDNVNIDYATSCPLPALLSITDLHITAYSSSIFEASYFKVPTILTHRIGQNRYGPDLGILNAIFCEKEERIISEIEKEIGNRF